jgi:uncharacterized protein (TIGR02001 family)
MKFLKLALCGATASLAMAGAANAAVSFNAGAVTEYLFRGLSQGSNAAGFGGVDWSSESGVYLGAWASSVGFGPSAEVDLYGGYKMEAGDVALDFGAIYYGYTNDPNTYTDYRTGLADSDISAAYYELYAKASFPVGMGSITGALYYSPDFFAEGGDATYYEIGFTAPWNDVTFSGAYGVQSIGDAQAGAFSCAGNSCHDSYNTWNVGFTVPITEAASVDVRYTATDEHAYHFGNTNLSGVAFDGITAKITVTK